MGKRGLHLHHVEHSGANRRYYVSVLNHINSLPEYDITVTQASLGDFINNGMPDGVDVLSYQTFPDEKHKGKFNPAVIYKSDCRFHAFSGRKIIVDTNDCGDKDAFSRMYCSKDIPRVKCFPSKWFLNHYNVILLSTISGQPGTYPDKYARTTTISCKFGKKAPNFYEHTIRDSVQKYLQESFSHLTDFSWTSTKLGYFRELRWTKVVVGAPGWGRYNGSYWGAFKAGAMLFAYTALNDIKLFPHSDLIDGDDFVSYDMFNFKMKLERILDDPAEIERIRNNGRKKFSEGLNYKKSAEQLVKFLKGGV